MVARIVRRTRLPLDGRMATYVFAGVAVFIVGTQVLLKFATP